MKYFMVRPDAGLGNRLNCIYSGLYFAREYGMELNIMWLRERCCNVPFEKLFKVPENTKIHTVYELGYKNKYALMSVLGNVKKAQVRKNTSYLDAGEVRHLYEGQGEGAVRDFMDNNEKVCLMSSGPFCDEEHFSMAKDMLKPSEVILDRVDEIMAPYRDKSCIGVHIRRTDHVTAINNSPLESFTEVLDGIEKDTPIYLATDDDELKRQLEKKYNCIPHITFSDVVSRSTEDGMLDAYVDMLCLSRCKHIYGSFGSTFSSLAAFMGDTGFTVIR